MDATTREAPASIFVADRALLPGGWTSEAVFEVRADGTLGAVGQASAGATTRATRIRGVVVPGIPNAHSHAFQRGLAGRAEKSGGLGDDFWGWRSVMYRFLAQLTPDDVAALAAWLYVEMLEAGYTSVAEFHYLHRDPAGRDYADPFEMSFRMIHAAGTAGIRTTLIPTVYMRGGFDDGPLSGGQKRFRMDPPEATSTIAAIEGSAPGGLVRTGLGLHSLRAVGLTDIRQTIDLAAELAQPAWGRSRPIHIHVAEQTGEVDAALRWVGARPVKYLLTNVSVDATWCLIHATHMTAAEVTSVAASGAAVALCPTTEANLGDGLFSMADYASQGGRFAVGSDSQISVSPVAELRLLEYGQRLQLRSRNVISQGGTGPQSTGRLLLDGAWSGGGQALGHSVTGLATGAPADLVVLDPEHPALVGHEDDQLLDAWIFSGEQSPIDRVMVGGQWQVEKGRHVAREPIRERFTSAMKKLL